MPELEPCTPEGTSHLSISIAKEDVAVAHVGSTDPRNRSYGFSAGSQAQ